MNRAVVLLSGGMDSATCLAVALRDNDEVIPLHTGYGQLTQSREHRAFLDLCDHYGIAARFAVPLDHLLAFGGSALTDRALAVPDHAAVAPGEIPVTYVPFRNGNLLAIAASLAETRGANRIYIGAVEADSSGYPDCRASFYRAYEAAIAEGTRPETRVELVTPLIALSKAEIVRLGANLGVPFHLTWSCYRGIERACGACDSCHLRLRGFRGAGLADPIPYEPGTEV